MAAKPSGNKSVLVIGLGRFGGSVAATLDQMGQDVLAVDKNPELVARWSAHLPTIQADMTDVQSSWRTTWTLTSSFKLFKGSNAAPWMGGWEGYIVLPSQANVTRLSGSMPLNIPQGFIK